jgi:AraC family transcriptional regulator of adaptative response / DNA-3-methyladenine glycosylase II
MSGFLKSRAIPGVEIVDENVYRRTIEVNGCAGTIELRHAPDASYLIMNVQLPAYDGLIRVVERARRIFDLGADLVQINTHLASSPLLAPLVRARPGLRVPRAWDPFELAVRAVLGQQVTVRGATTLAGRLVRELGRPLPAQTTAGNDSLTHLFPSAAILAASDLSAIGIPAARHKTIRVLAERVAAGDLVLDASAALDQTVAQLCSIPGIGEWTAHYIAMRALGEPDALPVGDLGLRRAVAKRDGGVSASHLARLAEQWRPWRAYAAMHLWCAES